MKKLIIFFNGWGVSKEKFSHLDKKDFEVKIIDLNETLNLRELENFDEINLISWSLGVYNSSKQLANFKNIKKAIAINGTCDPISKEFGIHPAIFRKMTKFLNKKSYINFIKNCDLEITEDDLTKEEVLQKKEILSNFQLDYKAIPSIFDYAIISSEDKIFPANSTGKYFSNCKTKLFTEEHFLFNRWNSWGEILDEF